jgi:hypothetical protein
MVAKAKRRTGRREPVRTGRVFMIGETGATERGNTGRGVAFRKLQKRLRTVFMEQA